jgi:hypothetical protein
MRIIKLLLLGLIASPGITFAEVFLSIPDTQVGTETPIQVSGLLSQEKVGFTLIRPDQTQILFSEEASDLGIIKTEIFGLHLKKTGDYTLSLSRHLSPEQKISQNFSVYLKDVSAYRSEIEVLDKSVAADGKAQSRVKITLKDAYGNLAPNVKTKVLSSRNEDLLLFPETSDQDGVLMGTVKSKTPGISVLSVLAGETSLFDKPEIVFYLSDSPIENIGAPDMGKFLKAQLFEEDDFQKAAYFSIEDLPAEVVAGRNYTFRVIAKDENGNIVKNYLSPIRFASTDNQATLPADYTFQEDDQGSHTFALSVTFATAGVQRFAVHELDNFDIVGELSLTIVEPNATGNNNRSITITSPQQNAITQNQLTLTGQAAGIDLLRIEDGPTILTEDLMTDEKGEFLYQTPELADGIHKFRVSSFDGSVSAEVLTIQVDSSAPESVTITTDPIAPLNIAQPFLLTLTSDEVLGEASCVLDNQEFSLQASGDQFVANLNAPATCGEYPVSCRVADLVGNEKNAPNATVLTVCGNTDPSPTPPPNTVKPTAVTNLRAVPATDRVTLFWTAAEDDKAIAQYEILFGNNPQNLDQKNITPDDRTQWYIDQLSPTDKYYFQVIAVDTDGNAGTPSNVVEGSLESGLHSSAPATPTSGPSSPDRSHLPIFLSLLAAFGVLLMLRRERII